mgnify:FL=1
MSDSEGEDSKTPAKDDAEIAKEIEEKCWEAFLAFDKEGSGQVASSEVKYVLEMMGLKMSESEMFKMISEIDPDNTGLILYSEFKTQILDREMERIKGSDETELLDAFVAMGGEPDGGGSIDASKLIETIKGDFDMTIDIEKLIMDIDEDGSGEIEFDEFKLLLQSE